ncbi:hypothetical protein JZK55_05860 [Dissulfurispira thermophila]|uniref:PSP1 C-terminal domain-containing protein n=2 Tax=root TaxID=1 RepID=A0A7G1GZ59_9BACT|nr:regulatory iron-sulfur-containing complex subunit RicT [Dissulfurispira thermophila]BCB95664.1 hypothetical protein JZK55_05860 [Dissulfurispira thermophila]
MPDVVGIRFKNCGKIYDFEVNGIDIKNGDSVVVESDFGLSIGKVVIERHFIETPERELKKVIRRVSDEDIKAAEENKKIEKEARDFCVERILARGLQMKLVGAETTLDRKRIIFYFTADGRIDFRELVKDLAARFKTRIEMRQIGVRDEAKLIGGLGVCGRELCCNTFLTSFEPVSIKMAKKQELVLNVSKLSGLCGRLMCCLRYEYEGSLDSISSDDEMPIENEELYERDTVTGISAVLSKLVQSDTIEEFVETSPIDISGADLKDKTNEQHKSEHTEHKQIRHNQTEERHKKIRHKRRHFRR